MRIAVALVCFALVAGLIVHFAAEEDSAGSAQDAWKAAHAAKVADELAQRDVSGLSATQRANRVRNLEELRAYGRRGRFAQNEDWPGEAIPHLIDREGTRCALANLIDKSGSERLLSRLAEGNNIAFVPELQHDEALGRWLTTQGLTVEEAAFIQGPGFVDPGPGRDPSRGWTDPTGRLPDANTPGARPAPITGGGRRGRGTSAVADWQTWWGLNRHAFLNLRSRYHDGAVVTGSTRTTPGRGRRPSNAEVDATVIPLLSGLAKGGDEDVRATALMAWARAAREKHAPAVIAATLDYLKDEGNKYRELMILALGVVRHPDALPHLRALLADTKKGRALLGRNSGITERTRAFAAIALGQAGQAEAMDDLMKVLDDKRHKVVDLKSCCVMGLGTIARDASDADRRRASAYLVKALRAQEWSDVVLAAIPTALANAGDDLMFVGTLQPILERFRKPTAVRQSSALAMAIAAPSLTGPVFDALVATARRDPDDNARRFGILAIGEVAARQPAAAEGDEKERTACGQRLLRYYDGAFAGRNIQHTDLPWLCISAALFGRGFPEHAEEMGTRLRRVAEKGGLKERQAAAIVALGVLGDKQSLPLLTKLYKQSRDKLVKGYLAETLGILGDKSQRETLLELVRTDGTGTVRYRAALGLGFAADADVVKSLVDTLATTKSGEAKVALARVIGEIGDRSVLPALIRVASDDKADVWTRRRALGAIGMIAEEEDHAWTRAFHRGANYPVATPTLRAILALF